jgi:hypothetical protein
MCGLNVTKPPLSSPAREYSVRRVRSSENGSFSSEEEITGRGHLPHRRY